LSFWASTRADLLYVFRCHVAIVSALSCLVCLFVCVCWGGEREKERERCLRSLVRSTCANSKSSLSLSLFLSFSLSFSLSPDTHTRIYIYTYIHVYTPTYTIVCVCLGPRQRVREQFRSFRSSRTRCRGPRHDTHMTNRFIYIFKKYRALGPPRRVHEQAPPPPLTCR